MALFVCVVWVFVFVGWFVGLLVCWFVVVCLFVCFVSFCSMFVCLVCLCTLLDKTKKLLCVSVVCLFVFLFIDFLAIVLLPSMILIF